LLTGLDEEIYKKTDHIRWNHILCICINNLDFKFKLVKDLIEALLGMIKLTTT